MTGLVVVRDQVVPSPTVRRAALACTEVCVQARALVLRRFVPRSVRRSRRSKTAASATIHKNRQGRPFGLSVGPAVCADRTVAAARLAGASSLVVATSSACPQEAPKLAHRSWFLLGQMRCTDRRKPVEQRRLLCLACLLREPTGVRADLCKQTPLLNGRPKGPTERRLLSKCRRERLRAWARRWKT